MLLSYHFLSETRQLNPRHALLDKRLSARPPRPQDSICVAIERAVGGAGQHRSRAMVTGECLDYDAAQPLQNAC